LIESLNKKQWKTSLTEKLNQKLSKTNNNKSMEKKPWYVLEEKCCQSYEMLGKLAEDFFRKADEEEKKKLFADAAWSLIVRHDLMNRPIFNKEQLKNYMKQIQNYTIMTNPIFENDSFNPMEENLGEVPPGSFINMKDFGLAEKDVLFIDTVDEDKFIFAIDSLEHSDIVNHIYFYF